MALREVLAEFGIEFEDKEIMRAEAAVSKTTQTINRFGRTIQSGVVSAGIAALRSGLDKLGEDHATAGRAAKALEVAQQRLKKTLAGTGTAGTTASSGLTALRSNLDRLSDEHLEAARAAKALEIAEEKLKKALAGTAEESDELTHEQLELVQSTRRARREFESSQHAVRNYEKRVAELGKSNTLAKHSFDLIKSGARGAAGAVAALGLAASIAGGAIGTKLFGAQDQARAIRTGFEGLLGSTEAGEQALKDVLEIAKRTAAPIDEIRQTLGTLLATGMSPKLAKDLSAMRFDFKAMGEEAEAAFGKLTDVMVEGEVSISSFEDLAKNLGGRDILGKALGLTQRELSQTQAGVEALEKRLKQIDPGKFLETVRTVAAARGEIGKISKDSASLGRRLESLSETLGHAFVTEMAIDDSSLQGLLKTVEDFAKSQEFKDSAREMGNALVGLGHIARDVAGFIVEHWGIIGPTIKGIGTVLAAVAALFVAAGATLLAPFYLLVGAIGLVVAGLTELVGYVNSNVSRIGAWFTDVAETMLSAFGGAIDTVKGWFTDLWQTITKGFIDLGKALSRLPGVNLLVDEEQPDQAQQRKQPSRDAQHEARQRALGRPQVETLTPSVSNRSHVEANDQRKINVNVTVPDGTPRDIARNIGSETASQIGAPSMGAIFNGVVPLAP